MFGCTDKDPKAHVEKMLNNCEMMKRHRKYLIGKENQSTTLLQSIDQNLRNSDTMAPLPPRLLVTSASRHLRPTLQKLCLEIEHIDFLKHVQKVSYVTA